MFDLSESDLRWIKKLDSEIWKTIRVAPDKWSSSTTAYEEARKLNAWELLWIFRLAKRHQLPCHMGNSHFGFQLSLTILNHSDAFLGDIQPAMQPLISITPAHLPFHRDQHGYMASLLRKKKTSRYDEWDRVWKFFYRLTHNSSNIKMLQFYKLPKPSTKSSYEY